MPLILPEGTAPTPTHAHADQLGKGLKGPRLPQLDWGCSDIPISQMEKQEPKQFPKHVLPSPRLISGHGGGRAWGHDSGHRHIPCPGAQSAEGGAKKELPPPTYWTHVWLVIDLDF